MDTAVCPLKPVPPVGLAPHLTCWSAFSTRSVALVCPGCGQNIVVTPPLR